MDTAHRPEDLCAGGYRPKQRLGGRTQAPRRERSGELMPCRRQSLHLEHAQGLENECDTEGPFDVVLMDLALPRLLHALLQVCSSSYLIHVLGEEAASRLITIHHQACNHQHMVLVYSCKPHLHLHVSAHASCCLPQDVLHMNAR